MNSQPLLTLTNTSPEIRNKIYFYIDGKRIDLYKDHLVFYYGQFLPWLKPRTRTVPFHDLKKAEYYIFPFDIPAGWSRITFVTNDGETYTLNNVLSNLAKKAQIIIGERNIN